jgi:hypothetical protein
VVEIFTDAAYNRMRACQVREIDGESCGGRVCGLSWRTTAGGGRLRGDDVDGRQAPSVQRHIPAGQDIRQPDHRAPCTTTAAAAAVQPAGCRGGAAAAAGTAASEARLVVNPAVPHCRHVLHRYATCTNAGALLWWVEGSSLTHGGQRARLHAFTGPAQLHLAAAPVSLAAPPVVPVAVHRTVLPQQCPAPGVPAVVHRRRDSSLVGPREADTAAAAATQSTRTTRRRQRRRRRRTRSGCTKGLLAMRAACIPSAGRASSQ